MSNAQDYAQGDTRSLFDVAFPPLGAPLPTGHTAIASQPPQDPLQSGSALQPLADPDSRRDVTRFRQVEARFKKAFPCSPFRPKHYSDWLSLRNRIRDWQDHRCRAELENHATRLAHNLPPVHDALEDPDFHDNRSLVLAMPTAWCKNFAARGVEARWPSAQEFKWEGDQRMGDTGMFGRFMPLPRDPANETVVWHRREVLVPASEMDVVRMVPTEEDVIAPVDEVDDEVGAGLIGEELMVALDEPEY